MKQYYYIGTSEYTVQDFIDTFINDDKEIYNRLFKLDDARICNTNETWSVAIFNDKSYHLRCNILIANMNINILCYVNEENERKKSNE